MAGRVRVYIASSFDGFIAGPGDDLSWLVGTEASMGPSEPGVVSFEDFMAEVGAMLMGRRTYEVVVGMGGEWPYGETPILVTTHRPIEPILPCVRGVHGDIKELVTQARAVAGDQDVYIDGGILIRQAIDAGLVDEMIVTVAPVLLGSGHALFAGLQERHNLELTGHYRFGSGMVQLQARFRR